MNLIGCCILLGDVKKKRMCACSLFPIVPGSICLNVPAFGKLVASAIKDIKYKKC